MGLWATVMQVRYGEGVGVSMREKEIMKRWDINCERVRELEPNYKLSRNGWEYRMGWVGLVLSFCHGHNMLEQRA